MKVYCDDNSTVGVVDSPVVGTLFPPYATISVFDNDSDGEDPDSPFGELYAVVKVSVETASNFRKVYGILHSFEMFPDLEQVMELIKEVDPSSTWVITAKE